MAILGKVAGTMLKDNLLRNGVDLVIDNNLVYFDVSNRRVGINTTLPGNTFVANGTVTLSNLYINNNVITSLNGNLQLYSQFGNIDVSNLKIGNVADPIFNTDAATKNYVDSAINLLTGEEFTSIASINANIAAANSSIISLNANVIAANSAISTLQSQVYSNSNVASYLSTYSGTLQASQANLGNFNFVNNTISVTNSNGNIVIQPNGSGTVLINTSSAIKMPTGDNTTRPNTPSLGMTRYNTVINSLETWNGSSWAAGGGSNSSTYVISDQFVGDGSTTSFTLSQISTTAGTVVSINGVIQLPDISYSISGKTLTLNEAPLITDIVDARSIVTTSTVTGIQAGNSNIAFGSSANNYPINFEVNSLNKFSINSSNVTVADNLILQNGISSSNANISLTQNTLTTFDTFLTSKFRTAKYVISISDYTNSKYQSSEVLVTHNGISANLFVYAGLIIGTAGSFVNFNASVSGNNVIVQANSTSLSSYCNFQQIYVPV